MFFALSKIAALFLKPLVWILALALVALLTRNKRQKWCRFCTISAITFVLVFTNPLVFNATVSSWEISKPPPESMSASIDIGIVLGGYSNSTRSSPEQLVFGSDPNRLTDAVRLYKTGKIRKLLLTGGTGAFFYSGTSEAPLAERFLLDLGIPASDIIIEPDSRNTHENAVFSARLLSSKEKKNCLLITSAIHMRRASACFKKAGITVTPYPTDLRGNNTAPPTFRSLLPDAWTLWQWEFLIREWVGTAAYRLSGRI